MWGVVPNGDCDAGQARGPLRAGAEDVTRSHAGKGFVRYVW